VCPGETVTFDGSGSIDRDEVFSDEGPLQYHWDFGSGNVAEGEIVTHIFDEPGQYEVRLTVSDDSETACGTGEDVTIVKVNAAPVAEAGHDRKAFVGGAHDAVLFDASQSYDPDEDPLTCYWDFGDGTRDFGEQVFHTYIKPGVYTVRLRVSDGEGTNCSEVWDQLTVVVRQRENAQ
ncbi:MAG TPA: PKD domain-containing protein, partial [Desulfobacterales bacterium]|nr:PKD domain-containing protein [Desulfobacterales bacterium]